MRLQALGTALSAAGSVPLALAPGPRTQVPPAGTSWPESTLHTQMEFSKPGSTWPIEFLLVKHIDEYSEVLITKIAEKIIYI